MLSAKKMENWKEKWSFLSGKTIFVACSGGVDSMVLLCLLRELTTKLTVLHVNFGLRGEASDLDAEFVSTFCRKHKIPVEVQKINMQQKLQRGGNLQAIARDERYAWFDTFLTDSNSVLAIAHHQDDQIENFFLNLSRKSGILGMASMLEIQENKIRPLLDFSKSEIYCLAKKKQIPWREDASNAENKYRRNKLRNQILPYLQNQIPTLKESILTLISHFQEEQKRLEKVTKHQIEEIRETRFWKFSDYNLSSTEERIEILRQLGFPARIYKELEKLKRSERGKTLIYQEKKWLKEENAFALIDSEIEIEPPSFSIERVFALPKVFTKDEIYLDASLLKGKLRIRKWEKEDYIHPVGIQGKQKLSDILKDLKLTFKDKSSVFILCDDETVHWVIGIKIGRKALANPRSKEILKITIN